MTGYANLKAQIADFANRQDWSDALVSSFVTMAEAKFNQELRVDRMLQNDQATIISRCAPLPGDWLAMDLVLVQNSNGANGYLPARYKSRDEFFNLTDPRSAMYYTIEGRQIYFGGTPDPIDGTGYQIFYYGEVPVFSDTQDSWIYDKYPTLYLWASLMHAALHAVGEEQQAANFKTLTEEQIQKLNAAHLGAKASGSRVTRSRVRSFG